MKRGELTTQQIVVLIILLISFAIILFFLFRLDLGKTNQEQLCHNSVMARGSSALPDEAVPLNCQRSYVCITEDGSCESLTKPEIVKVKTEDDVYEALAKEMEDCWWMFGEGKVNYAGTQLVSQLHCAICSQVAFDDSVLSIGKFSSGEIDDEDFYKYLLSHNSSRIKGKYGDYLYGTSDFNALKNSLPNNMQFGSVDLSKQQYVLTGISSDMNSVYNSIIGGAIGVGTGIVIAVTAPISVPALAFGTILATTGVFGGGTYFLTPITQDSLGNKYVPATIVEANSQEFEALKCKSIDTLS